MIKKLKQLKQRWVTFQSLSIVNRAVPLRVQCSGDSFSEHGRSIAIMKLVDCPVVERMPALTEVLQQGHSQISASYISVSYCCCYIQGAFLTNLSTGKKWIIGIYDVISPGSYSSNCPLSNDHRAPSMKSPQTKIPSSGAFSTSSGVTSFCTLNL